MLRGSLRLPYAAGSFMKKIGLQSVAEDIQAPLHSRIRRLLRQQITENFSQGERFYSERDLIKRLGVSQPTVRRALNDLSIEGHLEPSPRRGFFVRKTFPVRYVGVFSPAYHAAQEPFGFGVLGMLAEHCREQEIQSISYPFFKDDKPADLLKRIRHRAGEERIILCGMPSDGVAEMGSCLREEGYGYLVLGPVAEDFPAAAVSVDEEMGIDLAIEHLRKLGHRRVVFMVNEPAVLLITGRRAAILEKRLRDPALKGFELVYCGTENWSSSFDAAYRTVGEILARKTPPTAVCPLSCIGAWAVQRYAVEQGLKIPGDFSLMSLDYIPGSEYLPVPLTTVTASNGNEASLLLELLWGDSNGQGTRKERIAPHLQPRSSTAAPQRAVRPL